MANFEGKVGIVTAGATGIGFACAQAIVDGGGRVMICARREDTLKDASEKLGPNAEWIACDVTDDASVDAAVAAAVERLGPLNLAVNSAGTAASGPIERISSEDFARVLDTNLVGTHRSMRAQALAMKEAGGGSIVNISSIAGALTHPWMSPYCASKAGINMLTMCAADELGEHNIRVNAVMPSVVKTPMASILSDDEFSRNEYLSLMPISRIGRPEDVGSIVGFLLSDEASWMTGQVIGVDGGHTIRKGPNLVPLFSQFIPTD
jgi:NAD(P)-dependent dehydrogenase (short-subunit alcohol dehydrogenase family)